MVKSDYEKLSVARQCVLLGISRSSLYYMPKGVSAYNLALMGEIDRAFTQWPFFGVRQMRAYLALRGYGAGRKRVRRLMRLMGLEPIYQKPRTSVSQPEHKRYPYLLRDMAITGPDQVWSADIPMRKGFLYLVAIMDWYSRKVLSWRLSNTLDTDFCVSALEEALKKYGKPAIFNTDQGSQFTSVAFTKVLQDQGIDISMDGRGRWLDNVFVERLWRSLKYENVYLHAYETGSEARAGIGQWIDFYNHIRPHSSLGGITPNMCYEQNLLQAA
jgi:putative transposase